LYLFIILLLLSVTYVLIVFLIAGVIVIDSFVPTLHVDIDADVIFFTWCLSSAPPHLSLRSLPLEHVAPLLAAR